MKVLILEKNFETNKESGEIICKMTARVEFKGIESLKGLNIINNIQLDPKKSKKKKTVAESISLIVGKGKAVCSKKDEFNESLGIKIAANRARIDLYGKAKQILCKYIKANQILNDNLNMFFEDIDGLQLRSRKRVKELTK